jgi:phosphomannomutase/phosphoglucomutase
MMVSILVKNRKKLSEIVDQLPERHIIKEKIKTPNGMIILASLRKTYSQEKTDHTDGLKLFRKNSWGLVRASGTEPIVRIIVDSDNEKNGNALYLELNDQVQKIDGLGK